MWKSPRHFQALDACEQALQAEPYSNVEVHPQCPRLALLRRVCTEGEPEAKVKIEQCHCEDAAWKESSRVHSASVAEQGTLIACRLNAHTGKNGAAV